MALRWIALAAFVAGGMSTAQAEEGDFFPLEVGNRWVFQKYDERYSDIFRLDETVSTEVIGQVQLKEQSYFVVRKDWNPTLPDTLYLRKEGAQVFRYLEQPDTLAFGDLAEDMGEHMLRPDPHPLDPKQTDWLLYDFAAPQGTVWDLPLPENPSSPFVVIWWVFNTTPFREPPEPNWKCCWGVLQVAPTQRFFRFFATFYAMEWDEVFEVGVGPIYITQFTTEVEFWNFGLLKEAHIGGRVITRDWTTAVEQTSWGHVKAATSGDRAKPARAYQGR